MRDFRQLNVWEKAHGLVLDVYRATRGFPISEKFGLSSQLRRSAASIPANIAEGCGRHGNPELARFLQIAMGSAMELEYHFQLAHDLEFLTNESYELLHAKIVELKRMLASLIATVRATHSP